MLKNNDRERTVMSSVGGRKYENADMLVHNNILSRKLTGLWGC